MLPPPTIPLRSNNSSEAGSAGPTPASSSSSSALPTISSIAIDGTDSPNPASTSAAWTDRILVQSGVFAGRHMKFYLDVAQQPIHGRRKTEKDRRPLAHCPILRLRFKECKRVTGASLRSSLGGDPGWEEEDVDVATVESSNFICAADLVSPQETPSSTPFITRTTMPGSRSNDAMGSRPSASSSEETLRGPPDMSYHRRSAPMSMSSSRSVDGDITQGSRTERSYLKGDTDAEVKSPHAHRINVPRHSDSSPNVLREAHDAPAQLPEGMEELHETQEDKEERSARMFGRNLYGNSHVSGIRVPAPEGGVGLWFLFTDITVRHEGEYTLRFRCFDITAVPSGSYTPSPPLVAAESQVFKVYSPRNFPGIPRPTELAEHFNRLGFKLNTRKNERIAENLPPPPTSASGRTQSASSASSTATRRPSPQPVQHHERRHPTSSLGRYATSSNHNTPSSSSVGTAGSNSTSGTATGSLTDPSTGGSMLSAGAGSGSIPGAVGSGALASAGSSGGLSRINERVDDQGRIDGGSQ